MRPERLVLKGFGAFRQYTEIDFSGVELFALTGPTGAGKTTVLDGMCFALYGSVPRHGRRDVAPVVTQGLTESVVSLAFSVGDEHYQVARHVRKDSKRKTASTDEATVERAGQILATGADAVTAYVTALLGLDFEQFTTCVMLPQGEFQRFLHDKPANRQNLLSALLDLGVYERIGQLAAERRERATGVLASIDQRLGALGSIGAADEESAAASVAILANLLVEVEAAQPEIDRLTTEVVAAQSEGDQARGWGRLLDQVNPPENLDSLANDRLELTEQDSEIAAAQLELSARLVNADESLARLPSPKILSQWVEAWKGLEAAESEMAGARAAAVAARTLSETAQSSMAMARVALADATDQNRAAHLRQTLEPGHSCPVCDQIVETVPGPMVAAGVDEARTLHAQAEVTAAQAAAAATAAENGLLRLEERVSGLQKQITESPKQEDLPSMTAQVKAVENERAKAKKEGEAVNRRRQEIDLARQQLVDRERTALRDLQNARDRLATLEPPPLSFEDPAIDWKALVAWAADQAAVMARTGAGADLRAAEASRQLAARLESIRNRFVELDLRADDRPPRDSAVDALAQASTKLEQIQKARIEAVLLASDRLASVGHQEVAALLVKLLRNDGFKNWLLDEVFAALVTGANIRLADLTKGQYSLDISGREFEVIDNLSAGNRRSVRTLSGGETFLVSLGLALALADQVAETSVGSVRLESIFLDEGFGTLDAETLDVVASVISELGASGKTVGIVTHVAELAEQMPVRYEVDKDVGGATVTEVRR